MMAKNRVCAAVVLLAATVAMGQKAPDASSKTLQVHEGLEAVTFAAEPMFANPCDMDIDSKGRVWITEGLNYRSSKMRPEGDRIIVLEDTDGDAKADKAHTFYQGPEINSALGICILGDKIIVSCAPKVFLFEDKDGDLKADGKPKVIFSGISGEQHDHSIHAFVFGPDGKLYFNYGNAGGQLKTADGKPIKDAATGIEITDKGKPWRQGMVFRCDLDFTNVEVLAHNFRNNYEVAVDSFGTLWQSDNDDDGNRGVRINYVMEYGQLRLYPRAHRRRLGRRLAQGAGQGREGR
jgi:putative membrane-bound dehydrogenase-like protein